MKTSRATRNTILRRKVIFKWLLCSSRFARDAMRRIEQTGRAFCSFACCFALQDQVGSDLQKVLWDGLGPDAGEMLSTRTSFLVMPLFTAGSLEV